MVGDKTDLCNCDGVNFGVVMEFTLVDEDCSGGVQELILVACGHWKRTWKVAFSIIIL